MTTLRTHFCEVLRAGGEIASRHATSVRHHCDVTVRCRVERNRAAACISRERLHDLGALGTRLRRSSVDGVGSGHGTNALRTFDLSAAFRPQPAAMPLSPACLPRMASA